MAEWRELHRRQIPHGENVTSKWNADSLVNVRSQNVDRYKRNFLRQAVCEFRFPTLLELGGTRPPAAFVSALRKEYPHLELAKEVAINFGGEPSGPVNKHVFRSEKLTWTVSLKESAFSIETIAYTEYANLRERVMRVVGAASKIIDSDLFTRVGMRYINVIDAGADPATEGWINPELIAPLRTAHFAGVQEYSGRLNLLAEDGGCLLQHGIKLKQSDTVNEEAKPEWPLYLLDIDVHRTGVAVADAADALDAMHSQAFDVFDWAIGDAARDYLETPKLSKAERRP